MNNNKSRSLQHQANDLLNGKRKTRRGKRKKKGKSAKWNKEYAEALEKQKQMKKIPKMTYRQYMGSAYWKKRKNDYFGKHGKKCAVCDKKYGVTLHHKKYNNSLNGKESDSTFVALCWEHHNEFHLNNKLAKNMEKETDEYVETQRQFERSGIDDLSWIQ